MHTHRTVRAAQVEIRSGYRTETYTVPAGTTGVVEYAGIIGGEHCVMFRCPLLEANLMARWPLEVERI